MTNEISVVVVNVSVGLLYLNRMFCFTCQGIPKKKDFLEKSSRKHQLLIFQMINFSLSWIFYLKQILAFEDPTKKKLVKSDIT